MFNADNGCSKRDSFGKLQTSDMLKPSHTRRQSFLSVSRPFSTGNKHIHITKFIVFRLNK